MTRKLDTLIAVVGIDLDGDESIPLIPFNSANGFALMPAVGDDLTPEKGAEIAVLAAELWGNQVSVVEYTRGRTISIHGR